MAIYHLSCKPVCRSAGRSATAAAAYRAAQRILDERTGLIHDYSRKRGVMSVDLVLPEGAPNWATDRQELWNAAEKAERRKDACVAREFEGALPIELSAAQRRQLAIDFAKNMAGTEGCAVDVAIHEPSRHGDQRNYHAHMLRTTRQVTHHGLGAKLDTEKAGRRRKADLKTLRQRWATMVNAALAAAGVRQTIDHRSLKEQGVARTPTFHMGVAVTGIERRYISEEPVTEVGQRFADVVESNAAQIEIPRIDFDLYRADDELLRAQKALDVALLEKGQQDELRRSVFERIREHCRETDRNLLAASRDAGHAERDPERIAEACAAFNLAKRDRGVAQGFVEQTGQLARAFVHKIGQMLERIKSWISTTDFSEGDESAATGSAKPEPFDSAAASAPVDVGKQARATSLRIYTLATQPTPADTRMPPAQELAILKADLERQGKMIRIARGGGRFIGAVENIGQRYLVQNLGNDQVAIHERATLPPGLASGDTLDAHYDIHRDGSIGIIVAVNGEVRTDRSDDGAVGPLEPGSRGNFKP